MMYGNPAAAAGLLSVRPWDTPRHPLKLGMGKPRGLLNMLPYTTMPGLSSNSLLAPAGDVVRGPKQWFNKGEVPGLGPLEIAPGGPRGGLLEGGGARGGGGVEGKIITGKEHGQWGTSPMGIPRTMATLQAKRALFSQVEPGAVVRYMDKAGNQLTAKAVELGPNGWIYKSGDKTFQIDPWNLLSVKTKPKKGPSGGGEGGY